MGQASLKKQILICTPEEKDREFLKDILGQKHFLVLTDTCDQAMDILKNSDSISAVLLDSCLISHDKTAILSRLKELASEAILILLEEKSPPTKADFPADGVLAKPLRAQAVQEIILKDKKTP